MTFQNNSLALKPCNEKQGGENYFGSCLHLNVHNIASGRLKAEIHRSSKLKTNTSHGTFAMGNVCINKIFPNRGLRKVVYRLSG